MQNLGRIWMIFVLVFGLAWAEDGVEATVNTQEVVKGNPIQLRIKATGGSAAFPNIAEIDGISVTDRGSSKQSSMRITNDGMESETITTKTYLFSPKEDMIIPSFGVNISGTTYKTKPIPIKVVQSRAPQVQDNAKFSFVLKSDKKNLYVGESFVVTLYISVSDQLRGTQIGNFLAPSSSDFFLQELDGQKEYQKENYMVIEKRYIATSKKEGNFTIEAASAKLGQPDRSRQDIFGRYAMRWMPITSNTLDIAVKVQTKDADLIGDFKINAKVNAQNVKANKPVNLSVHIEGKGSLEDFEFPKYEIDGVTVYSDEAKVETKVVDGALQSTYSKSFAFISEEDFTIPAQNFSVLIPKDNQIKALHVKSYDIKIERSGSVAAEISPIAQNGVIQTNITQLKQTTEGTKPVEVKSVAWWMFAFSFALGALFMYMLRWLPKLKSSPYKESEALKILYAHMSEDDKIEQMVRRLYARKKGDKSVEIDKKMLKEMLERFS